MLHGWENLTEAEKETIERGVLDGAVYGGPYHAELSPTDACNYDCFFCNQAFVDRSQSLPIDLLKRMIDELAGMGLKSLRLSGGGEPLLHPKAVELLGHLKQHGIVMDNLTTNGFKLTPAIVEQLLALPTREIILSLNESDPDRYAAMMRVKPKAFDRVVENTRRLMAMRREAGLTKPKLIVQFFVWKENFRDVGRMVELAKELEADVIYLRTIFGLPDEQRMSEKEREQLQQIVTPIVESESRESLAIDFAFESLFLPGRQDRASRQAKPPCRTERDRYCYIGWYSMTIRGDGTVYPCCMLQQDPAYPSLGNVRQQSIEEIWTGPSYQQLRQELRTIAMQQGKVRDPSRLNRTRPFCAAEDECPLLSSMCDDAFYRRMNEKLGPKRRSLKQAIIRALGRTL